MNPNERGRMFGELRRDTGLTQEELAKKIGVTEKTIRRWETGKAAPRGRHLAALAKLTDKPISALRGKRGARVEDLARRPETYLELERLADASEKLAERDDVDGALAALLREFRDRLLAEARHRTPRQS